MRVELKMPASREASALPTASPWPSRSALVGREWELLAVEGKLLDRSVRLITLVGAGGVGKSRLAVEAGRAVSGEFARGVRVVDVAALGSAEAVRTLVGHATVDPTGDSRALLVLDGVEHHAAELAQPVADRLALDPGLTVLATGQRALRIYGERVVPVVPLTPPGPLVEPDVAEVQDNPAVLLFSQRAHEVNPDFTLTAENVAAVLDICNLLEGVPLALELAAARLRLFPVFELRSWLRRGGDSHLAGPVDVPGRQRSIRAVAEWSCRGISPEQRRLLAWLSIFEGGATVATVEKVSPLAPADTAQAIEALLDRSLLTLVEQPRADSRLTVSRVLRAYGRALLDEQGDARKARDAHARYFGRLLRTIEGRFHGSEQRRWLRVACLEHDNILAALDHLQQVGDIEEQASLLVACQRPWLIRGELRDGLHRCDSAAAALAHDDSERVLRLRARLHTAAGYLASARGDHDGAAHRHRRAVTIYKQLRDAQQGARASARLGRSLVAAGDREAGQPLLTSARSTLEWWGDTAGSAEAAAGLAEALLDAGALTEAGTLLDRALRIHRQNGEIRDLAEVLLVSARLAGRASDGPAAQSALRESLRLLDSIDDRNVLADALEAFAVAVQDGAGHPQQVTRLLAAADAMRRRAGTTAPGSRRDGIDEVVSALRRQLGATVFAGAWAEGARPRPEVLVAEALAVGESRPAGVRTEAGLLTPRQLQVALSVAEGMTNRQIANQLCIAEWTVVNHVRQVMRKLGCTSRVQVAWAVGRRR
ncbi:LuxR C-terminal-related transcriptional regulator [Micromonospora sp. WMMD1120]|uniref:ATP-binding protein n=1 Tax=Micromonospora sp. WMMD1120 TaxID=3016106 RepID=UPI002415C3CA|nr:LuxR C-terminal-related transcriptional regulator [Micromonospora sp. WMMD1120]MDG4809543.1 LuxR C-terminal-related transcriptional regulator [Micromonospora sp. WMMD1120]